MQLLNRYLFRLAAAILAVAMLFAAQPSFAQDLTANFTARGMGKTFLGNGRRTL